MATKHKVSVMENEELEVKQTGLPDVIMSEEDLINGLLEAADYDTSEDAMQPIEIRRNKKLFFTFRIRPLSEKEMMSLRKQCTKMYNNPAGKHLPKIEGDLDIAKFRCRKIYAATVDEDRAKTWDNPKVKAALKAKGKDIIENWEIIEATLMGGEKYAVSDAIDNLSGYGDDELELEEYAKN